MDVQTSRWQVLLCVILQWNIFAVGGFTLPFDVKQGKSRTGSLLLNVQTAIGFDLGTSGARVSIVSKSGPSNSPKYVQVHSDAVLWDDQERKYDDPSAWIDAVSTLLEGAADFLPSARSICFSGTSASCLIIDTAQAGQVIRPPCMYNFDVVESHANGPIYGLRALKHLTTFAPPQHTTQSPTSSLAKLLAWNEETPLQSTAALCSQADYLVLHFLSEDKACGAGPENFRSVTSDWHNALKLGYDVQKLEWPSWIGECLNHVGLDPIKVLPQRVVSPGEPLGRISKSMAQRFQLSEETFIVGGTTDSNAAFIAACGSQPSVGTAVTSLGSTLAIKQTSNNYIEDASVGVYSHRFPSALLLEESKASPTTWLVGGASNVGCAVLRQQNFSSEELRDLSSAIDPTVDSPLHYYPLTQKGERFPVPDSTKAPLLEPQPENRQDFLHGILQGISDVEILGFEALRSRGAPQPHTVYTSGGGSANEIWANMRQRRLQEWFKEKIDMIQSQNVEASFGAAILAGSCLNGDKTETSNHT